MTTPHHYLVRYGRGGFIGLFAAGAALTRGYRVVVRGPRGLELGEVLLHPERTSGPADGEVVRPASLEDDATAARLDARGRELLAAASEGAAALPLAFVDVEVTLDGTAVLHALAWDACDATPLLDELTARSGLAVRLLDLGRAPAAREAGGCGDSGCGSAGGGCSTCGTGGGCSTGSCSRGAVKSPDELTAYFADLRGRMERLARTPLN